MAHITACSRVGWEIEMKVYQVTKYDPQLYGPHGYTRDEWFGFREINSSINTPVLTFDEYFRVETAYAQAIVRFAETLGALPHLDRFDDYRHEIETPMDVRGITNSTRSFAAKKITDEEALIDFARLNLRGFIGADLIIPSKGFVDFGFDFYMYFGMKSDQPIDWAYICQGILFERDRSADLIDTDNFDKCIGLAGLSKAN